MTELSADQEKVKKILQEFPFPENMRGYYYLCTVIPLYKQNTTLTGKDMYSLISNSSPCDVELSIKRTIKYSWDHSNCDVWEKYFPGCQKIPSVYGFISTISKYLA